MNGPAAVADADPSGLELGDQNLSVRQHLGVDRAPEVADLYAVIEGVAFAIRGVVDAAEAFAGRARVIRVTGGGSHGEIWLQTIADVLGRRIEVAGTADASARGAALLAIAALTGRDPQRLAADWAEPGRPIDPAPETHDRYEAHYAIYREIYPATRHLMHRLTDLDRTS